MIKVSLISSDHPWVTWDNQLWLIWSKISDKKLELTTPRKSDIIIADWNNTGELIKTHNNKAIMLCVDSIEEDEISELKEDLSKYTINVDVLSGSYSVYNLLNSNGIKSKIWIKPTRILSNDKFFDDPLDKSDDFIMVSNAGRFVDRLQEVVRAFFAVCLHETKDGELVSDVGIDIYSAQDLPFETFNEIRFNGFQPNPMLFKRMKKSKLFISPYEGNGVPMAAIDAAHLGTPILVRDTEANRTVFNWNDLMFFSSEEELKAKMKYYIDLDPESSEYMDIVRSNFDVVNKTFSPIARYVELEDVILGEEI